MAAGAGRCTPRGTCRTAPPAPSRTRARTRPASRGHRVTGSRHTQIWTRARPTRQVPLRRTYTLQTFTRARGTRAQARAPHFGARARARAHTSRHSTSQRARCYDTPVTHATHKAGAPSTPKRRNTTNTCTAAPTQRRRAGPGAPRARAKHDMTCDGGCGAARPPQPRRHRRHRRRPVQEA
jgi:hypothetical protein